MSRTAVMMRKINGGINVDERTNTVIHDWSPNNLRRLIIGYNASIIQYYVKGVRSLKDIDFFDFERERSYNPRETTSKSILSVLVEGRVCSSIEEIIFCFQNYPMEDLSRDVNINILRSKNADIGTRFPRLHSIKVLDVSIGDAFSAIIDNPDGIIHECLGARVIADIYSNDYEKCRTGIALRPKYYSLDEGKLKTYFDKIRNEIFKEEREKKLGEIEIKRSRKTVEEYYPYIKGKTDEILSIMSELDSLYNGLSMISQLEWGFIGRKEIVRRGIETVLESDENLIKRVREVDKVGLLNFASEISDNEYTAIITKVLELVKESGTSDNKDTLVESIKTLRIVIEKIHGFVTDVVYVILGQYLLRNEGKFIDYYGEIIKPKMGEGIIFTRSIIAVCNIFIKKGDTKKAFDKMGFIEVKVDELDSTTKYNYCLKIINSLGGI